jgi:CBS domain-containing protein
MADQQVRRLPVLNRDKRLVGIISLGDISKGTEEKAGKAEAGITRPGGKHDQARH